MMKIDRTNKCVYLFLFLMLGTFFANMVFVYPCKYFFDLLDYFLKNLRIKIQSMCLTCKYNQFKAIVILNSQKYFEHFMLTDS